MDQQKPLQLKAKIILKTKSESTKIPGKDLAVSMKWTKEVDLDLMAFGKTKSGGEIAIFTDRIPGGNLGSLKVSPFIMHTGDQGVGAAKGEKCETINIADLVDVSELHIVVLNFSDAAKGIPAEFAKYDGAVFVVDPKNPAEPLVAVPLNSTESGLAAIVCKIDCSGPEPQIVNMNRIVSIQQLVTDIPAAMKLVE